MVKRCFGVSWDLEASLFLERMERARFLRGDLVVG